MHPAGLPFIAGGLGARRRGPPQPLAARRRADRRGRVRRVLPPPAARPADPARRGGGARRRAGHPDRRGGPARRAQPARRADDADQHLPVGVRRARAARARRGEVVTIKYRPGQFLSADTDDASEDNERNSVWIRTPEGVDVVAVQIAGLIARRIVCSTQGRRQGGARRDVRPDPVRLAAGHLPARRRRTCSSSSASERSAARRSWRSWPDETPRRSGRNRGLRILPSATTVLAICAGLTSIKFALDEKPWISLALIGAAAILDGIDGGIARALNAQSRMGAEIDSLADAVNFGVAPALVIYVTLLPHFAGRLDRRAAVRGLRRAAAGPVQRAARRRHPPGLHPRVLHRHARARAVRSGRSARWPP